MKRIPLRPGEPPQAQMLPHPMVPPLPPRIRSLLPALTVSSLRRTPERAARLPQPTRHPTTLGRIQKPMPEPEELLTELAALLLKRTAALLTGPVAEPPLIPEVFFLTPAPQKATVPLQVQRHPRIHRQSPEMLRTENPIPDPTVFILPFPSFPLFSAPFPKSSYSAEDTASDPDHPDPPSGCSGSSRAGR